jgi:hypothetical protein
MSLGHGSLQRHLLRTMQSEGGPWPTEVLACWVYDCPSADDGLSGKPPWKITSAVLRALNRLEQEGLVARSARRPFHWALAGTAAEQARARQSQREAAVRRGKREQSRSKRQESRKAAREYRIRDSNTGQVVTEWMPMWRRVPAIGDIEDRVYRFKYRSTGLPTHRDESPEQLWLPLHLPLAPH